jgi:hypothetical protein
MQTCYAANLPKEFRVAKMQVLSVKTKLQVSATVSSQQKADSKKYKKN